MIITTRLRVKELLRERRWTMKVLAEKTGISESYLTHIKNGTRRWNEDALKKLSEAFELEPVDLFDLGKDRTDRVSTQIQMPTSDDDNSIPLNLKLKIVPVVGEIPTQPSEFNNQATQVATGFKDQFVPVITNEESPMFCLNVQDSSYAPNFVKGDLLIIAPGMWTSSGDTVAVEYGNENPTRAIMQINFMDEFIVLESINHKKAPLALVKGKDHCRIIGKVIYRYQKLS